MNFSQLEKYLSVWQSGLSTPASNKLMLLFKQCLALHISFFILTQFSQEELHKTPIKSTVYPQNTLIP